MEGGFTRVASLADVPPGSVLGLEVGTERVCLVNLEGEIYALRNNCTHQDFPLSDGHVDEDGRLECAWHGSYFDVRTGRALTLPAIRPVKTYEVRVEGEDILVALE